MPKLENGVEMTPGDLFSYIAYQTSIDHVPFEIITPEVIDALSDEQFIALLQSNNPIAQARKLLWSPKYSRYHVTTAINSRKMEMKLCLAIYRLLSGGRVRVEPGPVSEVPPPYDQEG